MYTHRSRVTDRQQSKAAVDYLLEEVNSEESTRKSVPLRKAGIEAPPVACCIRAPTKEEIVLWFP